MEVIIREDIGVGCHYVGTAPYVIYEPEEIDYYYCQKVYARKMDFRHLFLKQRGLL